MNAAAEPPQPNGWAVKLLLGVVTPLVVVAILGVFAALNIESGNVTREFVREEIEKHRRGGPHPHGASAEEIREARLARQAIEEKLNEVREEVSKIEGRQQLILDALRRLEARSRLNLRLPVDLKNGNARRDVPG